MGGRGHLGALCGWAHLALVGSGSSERMGVRREGAVGPQSQEMFVSAEGARRGGIAAGGTPGAGSPDGLGLPGARPGPRAPLRGMVPPGRAADGGRLAGRGRGALPGVERPPPPSSRYGTSLPSSRSGEGRGLAPPPRGAQWWRPRRVPVPVAAAAGGR